MEHYKGIPNIFCASVPQSQIPVRFAMRLAICMYNIFAMFHFPTVRNDKLIYFNL